MHRFSTFMTASLLAASIAGCHGSSSEPAPSSSAEPAKEHKGAEPPPPAAQKEGLDARVDRMVEKAMAELHVPGVSVTVVRDGKVELQKGYGFADVQAKKPMTNDTTLTLASITKIFTTVAVLELVDRGKVKLDDPYSKYMKDPKDTAPAWSAITVRQLLAMQSGIPAPPPMSQPDPSAIIAWAAAKPLLYPPGTKTNYSNTNFEILGHLIEAVSGQPYEAFLRDNVLTPLGMSATRLLTSPAPAGVTTAIGYEWANGKFEEAIPKAPKSPFSSGGLVSSQVDLERFDAGMRAEKLLSKESYAAMFSPQPHVNGAPATRGLGWDFARGAKGKRRVGKGGDTVGHKTYFAHAVDEGVSVILLANSHEKKLNGVALAIFQAALKDEEPPPEPNEEDETIGGE